MTVGQVIAKLGVDPKEYEKGLRKAEAQANKAGSKIGGIFKNAFSVTLGVGMFEALKKGFKSAVGTAISFNSMLQTAQIGFATMLGSAEKAQKFLEDMADFAVRTPFEYPELLEAAKRMLAYGFAAEEVLPTLRAVGDASAALGSGAVGIDRITLALGQIQAKGKLSAEEMRQLTEAGVPAWDMLAEAMGKTVPELQDMVSKGLVPGVKAVDMLTAGMTKRFGGMMASMEDTWQGVTSSIKDIWRMTVGTLTQNLFGGLNAMLIKVRDFLSQFYSMLNAVMGKKAKQATDGLVDSTKDQAAAMTDVGDATEEAAKKAKKNLQTFDEVHQLAEETSDSLGAMSGLDVGDVGGVTTGEADVDTSAAEKLAETLKPIIEYLGSIKDRFVEFYDNVKPSLQDIVNILLTDHNPAWKVLKIILEDIASIVKVHLFNGLTLIEYALGIIADLLKGDFNGAWEKFKMLTKEIDWKGLYSAFEILTNPIGWVTKRVLESTGVFDGLKMKWEELKTSAPIIWENIKTSILTRWENLKTNASEIWGNITTGIKEKWNDLKTNAPIVWEDIKTSILTRWENLKTNASEIWANIKATIEEKWGELRTNAPTAWNSISNTIRNSWIGLKNSVPVAWNEIKSAIADKWREIKEDAFSWGKNLITGFVDGIKEKVKTIKLTLKNVGNTVKDFIGFSSPTKEGPGRDADKWAPNLMKMFAEGISQSIPEVHSAVSDMTKQLTGMIQQPMITQGTAMADNAGLTDTIAQAVYRAIIDAFRITQASSTGTSSGESKELVLKIDNTVLARMQLPAIIREGQRQGLNLVIQGV
jgi:tape measure domain-containing protein